MGPASRAALVALLAMVFYYAVNVLPRRPFPVHASGAVLITGTSSGIGTWRREAGIVGRAASCGWGHWQCPLG